MTGPLWGDEGPPGDGEEAAPPEMPHAETPGDQPSSSDLPEWTTAPRVAPCSHPLCPGVVTVEGGDGEVEEARVCGFCGGRFHAACLVGHPNAAGNMVCEGGIPGSLGGKLIRWEPSRELGASWGAGPPAGRGAGWMLPATKPADSSSVEILVVSAEEPPPAVAESGRASPPDRPKTPTPAALRESDLSDPENSRARGHLPSGHLLERLGDFLGGTVPESQLSLIREKVAAVSGRGRR